MLLSNDFDWQMLKKWKEFSCCGQKARYRLLSVQCRGPEQAQGAGGARGGCVQLLFSVCVAFLQCRIEMKTKFHLFIYQFV